MLWRRLTWCYEPLTSSDRVSEVKVVLPQMRVKLRCQEWLGINHGEGERGSIADKRNCKLKKALWQECTLFAPMFFASCLSFLFLVTSWSQNGYHSSRHGVHIQVRKKGKESNTSSICPFYQKSKSFLEVPQQASLLYHWPERGQMLILKSILGKEE